MTIDSCFGSFNGEYRSAFETFELQHNRSVPHREAAEEGEGAEAAGQECGSKPRLHGLRCSILQTILMGPPMSCAASVSSAKYPNKDTQRQFGAADSVMDVLH